MSTRTTRTTRTTAPQTAAEAFAIAQQLDAAERDLNARRQQASKEAEIRVCVEGLDEPAKALGAEANRARAAWNAAGADPTVGLAELFDLYQQMRLTSAARTRHVGQLSARWDDLAPIRAQGGAPVTHRLDTHDSLEPGGGLAFATALEAVLQQRANAAADAAQRAVLDRLMQARTEAADAVE